MVATQELQAGATELVDDASSPVAADPWGEVAGSQDNADTPETPGSSEAASFDPASVTDEQLDADLKALLDYRVEQARSAYEQELRPQIEQNIRALQSKLDQRASAAERESAIAQLHLGVVLQHIQERWQAAGLAPEELGLELMEANQVRAERDYDRHVASANAYWKDEAAPDLERRYQELIKLHAVDENGRRVFTPEERPDILAARREAMALAERYYRGGSLDQRLLKSSQDAFARLRGLIEDAGKHGSTKQPERNSEAARRRQVVAQQKQTVAQNKARGVQLVGQPGGGAKAPTLKDFKQEAMRLLGREENDMDVYTKAVELQLQWQAKQGSAHR